MKIDFNFVLKKMVRFTLSIFLIKKYFKYLFLNKDTRFRMNISEMYPCLKDKTFKSNFDRHYIYHTAWAARKVRQINPQFHVDISSSLYFSGIVSAFVPVRFYDFRVADVSIENLESKRADLLSLPFEDCSVGSLSCMHVVEHIGLGRYGDRIDPDADLKAIANLTRVLAVGGDLLFVVPIGCVAKIEFNAHRIYTFDMIMTYFKGLTLKEFVYIPEADGVPIRVENIFQTNDNYGCGCFWFVKKHI